LRCRRGSFRRRSWRQGEGLCGIVGEVGWVISLALAGDVLHGGGVWWSAGVLGLVGHGRVRELVGCPVAFALGWGHGRVGGLATGGVGGGA